jgi:HK97 family phage prohead protease
MSNRIEGFAAIWDRGTTISDGRREFLESVRSGAFTRSLREGTDVLACIDHDPARLLGRVSAGTLELRETDFGLFYSITPPEDVSYVKDLKAQIRAGNIRGSSFSFRVPQGGDSWDYRNRQITREIRDATLLDVSVVVKPAYSDTEHGPARVVLRSADPLIRRCELREELDERARQFKREFREAFRRDPRHLKLRSREKGIF